MRVLALCHGNINRSPLCEAVLAERGVEALSAGFKEAGRRAAKKTRDAAALHGYDLEQHRSQTVTPELLSWADLVVLMDRGNRRRLFQIPAGCRFIMLGAYVGLPRIPDPAFLARDSEEFLSAINLVIQATHNMIGDKELRGA